MPIFQGVDSLPDSRMDLLEHGTVPVLRHRETSIKEPVAPRPCHQEASSQVDKSWIPPSIIQSLRETVLALSDQQLVTATSLQLVVMACHCETTQYYATVAIYLAYVASNTYQACLLAVADLLLEKRGMRIRRLSWMLLLDILLVPTNVLVFGSLWLSAYGMSTTCRWQNFGNINPGLESFQYAFALQFILWSITNELALLIPSH